MPIGSMGLVYLPNRKTKPKTAIHVGKYIPFMDMDPSWVIVTLVVTVVTRNPPPFLLGDSLDFFEQHVIIQLSQTVLADTE